MNAKETNALLRKMVFDLIEFGWGKTRVGKALLGDNGQGHVNHWLKIEDNKVNDFGIKPLQNIADQIKCDVHVVFVPKNGEDEFKEKLDYYNFQFIENLKTALSNYLKEDIPKPAYTRQTISKLDLVLNDLLGITPENNNKEEEIDQNDLAPEEM